MLKLRQEKSLFSLLFTTESFTACRYPKLSRRLVMVHKRWVSALSTLFSTPWRKKDFLSPVGEMRDAKNEGEQDGAITASQPVVLPLYKLSSPSVPACSLGNLAEEPLEVDAQMKAENEKLQLQVIKEYLQVKEAYLEQLEKNAALDKRYRRFREPDPSTQTWASRWVACPVAYLFPEDRREEWLGDLHETNQKMLREGYDRWAVNVNNVIRTAVLVLSALKIKLSDFISLGSCKSE